MPESFDYKEAPDLEMLGSASGPVPSRRGFMFWLGLGLNAFVGLLIAVPILGYVFSTWKRDAWQQWVTVIPGKIDDYPKGQTRLATFRNPKGIRRLMGWLHRRHPLLGSTSGRWLIHSLCHQLHAPWLPRAMVPRIKSLHVPLPRWGLLRRRWPCRWATTPRTLHLQDRRRSLQEGRTTYSRRPSSHAAGTHLIHVLLRTQLV